MDQISERIAIDIGGVGPKVRIPLDLVGSECRMPDFRMALTQFAKDWKRAADSAKPKPGQKKPCGCGDKNEDPS